MSPNIEKQEQKLKLEWRVIGASVQGELHRNHNIPCQDVQKYGRLPDNILLIAVADGAGSAERSDEGAQLVVEKAVDFLTESLKKCTPENPPEWETLLLDAFAVAKKGITARAEELDIALEEFATTLTCVVLTDEWLAIGQIGDGAVIIKTEDGKLETIVDPQSGEYVNETFFITMADITPQIEITHTPVQAIAVMTDGLIDSTLIARKEPYSGFFDPLLNFVSVVEDEFEAEQKLKTFLSSDQVAEHTYDDKTLVLAARASTPSLTTSSS